MDRLRQRATSTKAVLKRLGGFGDIRWVHPSDPETMMKSGLKKMNSAKSLFKSNG